MLSVADGAPRVVDQTQGDSSLPTKAPEPPIKGIYIYILQFLHQFLNSRFKLLNYTYQYNVLLLLVTNFLSPRLTLLFMRIDRIKGTSGTCWTNGRPGSSGPERRTRS